MQHVGKKPSKGRIARGMDSDLPGTSMLDFESMIDKGSPQEFRAQTVNGTAHWAGSGWNSPGRAGWAAGSWENDSPQLPNDPLHPAGRSNRTGE